MSRRTVAHIVLSIAGVALLVWQVQQAGGWPTVRTGLGRVGSWFGLILLAALARFTLRSYAWLTLLDRPAPLATALAATISGDAIGNITPLGLAASEPAKAMFLGNRVAPDHSFAALTAENFFYSVSVAVYIIVGTAALFASFDPLPDDVRASGVAALVLMALVLAAAGWVAWQRPAAASALLSRLPSTRLKAMVERVRDFEVRTYGSAGRESARLGRLALAEVAFHIVSFAESWLTLWLLTGESLPVQALVLDSVNRVINVAFKLVPMRLGVDEVSAETVAGAIGLAAGVGLQAALVRRVRMFGWAAVGLMMWMMRGTRKPVS